LPVISKQAETKRHYAPFWLECLLRCALRPSVHITHHAAHFICGFSCSACWVCYLPAHIDTLYGKNVGAHHSVALGTV